MACHYARASRDGRAAEVKPPRHHRRGHPFAALADAPPLPLVRSFLSFLTSLPVQTLSSLPRQEPENGAAIGDHGSSVPRLPPPRLSDPPLHRIHLATAQPAHAMAQGSPSEIHSPPLSGFAAPAASARGAAARFGPVSAPRPLSIWPAPWHHRRGALSAQACSALLWVRFVPPLISVASC